MVGGAAVIPSHVFKDLSYTALGHLHEQQDFQSGKVHYSGSPLKYSFSEAEHEKSVTIVEMDKDGGITKKLIPLKPIRDMRKVTGFIDDKFQFCLEEGEGKPNADDFIEVALTNKEVVLNAMQIVQQAYPNAMSLKWINRTVVTGVSNTLDFKKVDKLDEMELFGQFFSVMMGEELDKEKREVVASVIETVKNNLA